MFQYFFAIYRLYLNYNAKLTAGRQVINYRQKFCNNVILTQTFCLKISLREKQRTIKDKLIFRACLFGLLHESSLLKLNRPCLELNYFNKDLKKNIYRRVHS